MENNGLNILGAIILGATVGAATALLLAPESGKRTRKKINRKLRDINEKLEDVVETSKSSLSNFSSEAQENLNDLAKRGKKIVSN